MKKKILAIFATIMLLVMTFSLVACNKKNEDKFEFGDPGKKTVVEGLSAKTIVSEAYTYWQNGTNYVKTEEVSFKAQDGIFATFRCRQVQKKMDNLHHTVKISYGTKAGAANEALEYFSDGKDFYIYKGNGKNIVPGKEDGADGIFTVLKWGKMDKLTSQNEIDKWEDNLDNMFTDYKLRDANDFASNTNDTVYKINDSGLLYCEVFINASGDYLRANQAKAFNDYSKTTGGEPDSIKVSRVEMHCWIEEVNGQYRIVKWQTQEDFSGKKGIEVKCDQRFYAEFSYDENDFFIDQTKLNK